MSIPANRSVIFVHEDASWHVLDRRFTADNGGWHVLHSCNAETAQRVITTEKISVGVIDLRDYAESRAVRASAAILTANNRNVQWLGVLPVRLPDNDIADCVSSNISGYLTAPLNPDEVHTMVTHSYLLSAILSRARAIQKHVAGDNQMVGASAAMQKAFADIRKMASSDAPVFMSGESGTGKELAAKAIHQYSHRAQKPFVAIDCGAVPPTLIHSELFGYERGAFTGANQRKIGRIESAQGGTLFLDEIGSLPLDLQGYLLRFLQESTIQRVGGLQPIRVDVRVIVATHLDLEAMIKAGRFREDLYYRLNVVRLKLPPLRERKADIALLAKFFLNHFGHDTRRNIKRFTPAAIEAMNRYAWPGNVRELINCVRRAIVMGEGNWITPACLDLPEPDAMAPPLALDLATARLGAETKAILAALYAHNDNVSRAARALHVSRVTLYRMMQRNGMDTHAAAGDALNGAMRQHRESALSSSNLF